MNSKIYKGQSTDSPEDILFTINDDKVYYRDSTEHYSCKYTKYGNGVYLNNRKDSDNPYFIFNGNEILMRSRMRTNVSFSYGRETIVPDDRSCIYTVRNNRIYLFKYKYHSDDNWLYTIKGNKIYAGKSPRIPFYGKGTIKYNDWIFTIEGVIPDYKTIAIILGTF